MVDDLYLLLYNWHPFRKIVVLPNFAGELFQLGLVSCAFSAGGSALTALTTSFTVDILGVEGKSEEKVTATRKKVHLAMAVLMEVVIFVFYILNTQSAIDMVYKLASYTYGPILGMFAFGIFTKWHVRDRWVPLIAILAHDIIFNFFYHFYHQISHVIFFYV